ncbi:TetR/AcrR family transcriptional regulator [Tundrisphaera sp. TA3]|uniref:TetR/AcrR family transcriptional regulator n=1 Tax=Tundrisphaera sp. TA3 TaxID=3435775 RepID=UPI003EBB3C6D
MGTTARKQKEVSNREQMLLDVARRMLIEQGFAGLTMDRLAEATEYSKGTIYQHFSTKEDLVAALAVQSCQQRLDLFGRATRFDGVPRARLMGLLVADELFAKLHPHHFRSEMVIRMADLDDRASAARRDALGDMEGRCLDLVTGLVRDAIAGGDLSLQPPQRPEGVSFALVSLALGTQIVLLNFDSLVERLGIDEPFAAMGRSLIALLDGLGWRPLSSEFDYAGARGRIIREVFADECRAAGIA